MPRVLTCMNFGFLLFSQGIWLGGIKRKGQVEELCLTFKPKLWSFKLQCLFITDTSTFILACSLWLRCWKYPNWNTISLQPYNTSQIAPVLFLTYLENSHPVTALHCPMYVNIWLLLISDGIWLIEGIFIRNVSGTQKCHPSPLFPMKDEKAPKAGLRESFSSQDLQTVLEFLKWEGS